MVMVLGAVLAGCGTAPDTTPAGGGGAGGITSGTAGAGTGGRSGAGGQVGPTPAPAGASEACAAYVKATCGRRDACSAGKGNGLEYGSAMNCETRELPKCMASLSAAGTSKTVAALMACTAAIPQQSCSNYFDNVAPAACRPLAGSLADGAACLSSWQCKSTFCALPHGDVCGVCAPRPKAGDSCAQTVCGIGLLCHASTQQCVASVALNAPCDKNAPCAAGLGCVGNTATVKGVCKAEGITVGAACDPKSTSAAGCDKDLGLQCDPVALTCKLIPYADDGQPCGLVAGGTVMCKAGGLCVGGSATTAGVCKTPVKDGQACNVSAGPPCATPAKCVRGVCVYGDPAVCK
jgi:hypothetical protein